MKKCSACLIAKPYDCFTASPRGDGYVAQCKPCRSKSQKKAGKPRACKQCGIIKDVTEFDIALKRAKQTCRECCGPIPGVTPGLPILPASPPICHCGTVITSPWGKDEDTGALEYPPSCPDCFRGFVKVLMKGAASGHTATGQFPPNPVAPSQPETMLLPPQPNPRPLPPLPNITPPVFSYMNLPLPGE